MSHSALTLARRWAVHAALFSGLAVAVLWGLIAASSPAAEATSAQTGLVPASSEQPAPSPSPSFGELVSPPAASVSLVKNACDTVRLSAQTEPGVTLTYRIIDESGHTAATGTFTGSADKIISLTTGHVYSASVSESAEGPTLAGSETADLTDPCPVAVAADAPSFSDPCGVDQDAVVAPRIIGVDYRVGETVLVAGANSATGTVHVVASAREGYVLQGASQWSHTFSAAPCQTPPAGPGTGQSGVGQTGPGQLAPGSNGDPRTGAGGGEAGLLPGDRPVASHGATSSASAQTAAPRPFVGAGGASDSAGEQPDRPTAGSAGPSGPGPLAWGLMIAVALAGAVVFWRKTHR